jgi:hypothetical protein
MEKDQSRRSLPAQIGKGAFEILLPSDREHDQLQPEYGGPGSQVAQKRFQKSIIVGLGLLAVLFLGYIIGASTSQETAPVAVAAVRAVAAVPAVFSNRTSASAISGADLLIDLDKWAGKEVYLTDVRVHGADNNGALGRAAGVTYKITTKGIDKETHRMLLKNCSSGTGNPACDGLNLTATPTGEKSMGWPVLINVRIGR